MVDFVEEVEEQLRAERYANIFRRYLPWFLVVLSATVVGWLGVWGYDTWRDHNIGLASESYDKALSALASGDQTGAFTDLAPVAKNGPAAYRTLALMQQANIRIAADKPDEAVALLDAAAKAAPSPLLKDLAALRAAQAAMDTAPYAQMETRLKPLAADKRPFSLQAKELLAMAKLQAGKTQEARGDFNAISLTLGVSPGTRARALGAIALIDSGQGALVGDVVRTAVTLPPSNQGMVPGLPGAPAPGAPAGARAGSAPPEADSAQPPAGSVQ